jgi:hypothetical protein
MPPAVLILFPAFTFELQPSLKPLESEQYGIGSGTREENASCRHGDTGPLRAPAPERVAGQVPRGFAAGAHVGRAATGRN